jgi:hypothetical protein
VILQLAQRKLDLHERLAVLAAEERDLTLRVTRAEARFTHACKAREEHTKLESEKQQQNVETLREDTQQDLVRYANYENNIQNFEFSIKGG